MSFSDDRGHDAAAQLAGFAIAVLGSAALFSVGLVGLFAMTSTVPLKPLEAAFAFGGLFLASALVIALAMIVIGLPLTLFFARADLESPAVYPLSGTFAGAGLIVLVETLVLGGGGASAVSPALVLLGAVPGALCGWLWWQFHRASICRERSR